MFNQPSAIVLWILGGAVAVYLGLMVWSWGETRDAQAVDQVQVSLQAAVSKGVAALDLPPSQIDPANLINSARTDFPKGVSLSPQYILSIRGSNRQAQFTIEDSGHVVLSKLWHFSRFHIENGRISRQNHLLVPTNKPEGEVPTTQPSASVS